jgi:TPR repeat protein
MAEERIKGAKIIASKYASQEEVDALEDLYFAENRHFDAIIQDTRALVVLGLLAEVEVKDGKKAANYYQLAAVQGNSQAQAALGVLYFTGRGVPQNMI